MCEKALAYIPMINNSVELIRPVNGSRNKHAKDNASPPPPLKKKAQNTMNIPRSHYVETEIYITEQKGSRPKLCAM